MCKTHSEVPTNKPHLLCVMADLLSGVTSSGGHIATITKPHQLWWGLTEQDYLTRFTRLNRTHTRMVPSTIQWRQQTLAAPQTRPRPQLERVKFTRFFWLWSAISNYQPHHNLATRTQLNLAYCPLLRPGFLQGYEIKSWSGLRTRLLIKYPRLSITDFVSQLWSKMI